MKITTSLLRSLGPNGKTENVSAIATAMSAHLERFEINTPLRLAHFLAQAAHETGGWRLMVEGGKDSYFSRYDGRKDLGNLQPGDGLRYKGRGIFQLTGRSNYRAYGKRLGLDLETNPAQAAVPDTGVLVACEYWRTKKLNAWADRDDVREITRRINGGFNGLADRLRLLAIAKQQVQTGGTFGPAPVPIMSPREPEAPDEKIPDAPIAPEPSKKWWESTTNQSAIGGYVTSMVGAVSSPYGLAALALVAIVGGFFVFWIIRERMKREGVIAPVEA